MKFATALVSTFVFAKAADRLEWVEVTQSDNPDDPKVEPTQLRDATAEKRVLTTNKVVSDYYWDLQKSAGTDYLPATIWDGCYPRPDTTTTAAKDSWWTIEKRINENFDKIRGEVYELFSRETCFIEREKEFEDIGPEDKQTLKSELLKLDIYNRDKDASEAQGKADVAEGEKETLKSTYIEDQKAARSYDWAKLQHDCMVNAASELNSAISKKYDSKVNADDGEVRALLEAEQTEQNDDGDVYSDLKD